MTALTNRPLVCIALGFVGGIALAARQPTISFWLAGLVFLIGILFIALFSLAGAGFCKSRSKWRVLQKPAPSYLSKRSVGFGITILGAAALAGAIYFQYSKITSSNDVSLLPEGGQTLVGTVAGPARYSYGVWNFIFTVQEHADGECLSPVSGKCYVRMTSTRQVKRGQQWRLTGRLRKLKEARNPGGRSEAVRFSSLGVSVVFSVGAEELAELLGEGELGPIATHAYNAQRRALRLLECFVTAPYQELTASVAASVIFGVHASPPPAVVTEAFRRAGTIHLLVVSGAMVSTLFGLVFLPGIASTWWRRIIAQKQTGSSISGKRGHIKYYPSAIIAIAAIIIATYYAILTEGGQAIARAAIMGIFVGLAFTLRRIPKVAREHGLNIDHYTLLAVAGLAILAVQPLALFQPGFQLSFAAVWAIIYLTPKIETLLPINPRPLRLCLIGTLAAQLATFPILAWHYGQAPIAGFLANILAVPLAGVVLVAGMATCALGIVAPWAAPISGWMTGLSTTWLVRVSSFFGSLPWASPHVTRPGWLVIMMWYAGMVGLGMWLEKRRTALTIKAQQKCHSEAKPAGGGQAEESWQ